MARLGGAASRGQQGAAYDFYTGSRATIYPSQSYATPGQKIPGQSKYESPEAEAAARPYAGVGKFNVNLFGGSGSYTPEVTDSPYTYTGQQPGAAQALGASGIPGAALLGGGIDLLAGLASHIPEDAKPQAIMFARKLRDTPDSQLTETELEIKRLNEGIFAEDPDSPIMQGKQVGEMYRQFEIAEAHKRGESAVLTAHTEEGLGMQVINNLMTFTRRGIGSLPFNDQLGQVTKPTATINEIGEERWAIRESLAAGEINEEEARDMIALSGFSLSNPNPIKLGSEFGPLDTIANAALSLGGELISDPTTFTPLVLAKAGTLTARATSVTFRSIQRTIAREIVEQEIKNAGRVLADSELDAIYKGALKTVSDEAERVAGESLAKQAPLRHLPKSATEAAKAGEAVGPEGITQLDRVEALLDIGKDRAHPWSQAISRGIEGAGTSGHIAVKTPKIVKMGQAVDRMTDPFTLFGYWRTGRKVPIAMSKMASHGHIDALGWRTARVVDSLYDDAGVDPGIRERARNVAAANHTVQAAHASNLQRSVSVNSVLRSGESNTEAALRHASRRQGDIRRLVRDHTDRTLEFIVAPGKGKKAEALKQWRERASKHLQNMGATVEAADAAAARMGEREMRVVADDHWGYVIETFNAAKKAGQAAPTLKWPGEALERVTFMGPRQMAQQDAKAVMAAIADGNVIAVREFIRKYSDLNNAISEDLDDAALLARTRSVLTQIEKALPVRIEDISEMPQPLRDFARDHPTHSLMLRPDDNNLLIGIRDETTNRITSMKGWVDHIDEATPRANITRAKAWRETLFRGISGGEVERNAARRFAANMAESDGLSEAESAAILRSLRETAETAGIGGLRGLTSDQIVKAVDDAAILTAERKVIAKRGAMDALFEAYENEMRLVGATPKFTGWVKKQAHELPGGNSLGWLTEALYPAVRFTKNPLFFLQELPEAPFFLALMGRYPASQMVPDVVASALGPAGRGIRESKANTKIYNDKTLIVMDRMTRASPNSEYDFFESAELVRMGLTMAAQVTDPRTPLGKLLKAMGGGTPLPVRKQRNVALAARYEMGEQWRRSLMRNSPQQWNAVRAYYPDSMSDGEVAIEWMLDLMARSDPDSIYSIMSPTMVRPSHIGARAEISDHLVRYFVYGDDADSHTWDSMVTDIREGRVSVDQVRGDLTASGADPDYVERAMTALTFGSADDFYEAARLGGISDEAIGAWKKTDAAAAELQGISHQEYLSRRYVGRPLSVDQMGNIVGETLFDDIVMSMRLRGRPIPEPDSTDVADLKRVSNEMITEVFPEEVADVLPKAGMTKEARAAAIKSRNWMNARKAREADADLGAPPTAFRTRSGSPAPGVDSALARIETAKPLDQSIAGWNPEMEENLRQRGLMHRPDRAGQIVEEPKGVLYAYDDAGNLQGMMAYTAEPGSYGVLNVLSKTPGQGTATRLYDEAYRKSGDRFLTAIGQTGMTPSGKAFAKSWLRRQVVEGPLYQTNLHTIGRVTPEQYKQQILTMMDPEAMSARGLRAMTEKDAVLAIEWYDHIRRAMFALVDDSLDGDARIEQAARILISFGTTQLNTSPADGFRHVFRAHGMKARGETLQTGEAMKVLQATVGLNPKQLQNLVWGEGSKIQEMGIGQKLFDFIDSLTGSKVRTGPVKGPNGNWGPVAVDIWTKRDFGFLDPKMADWVYRLVERETPEGLVRGTSSTYEKGVGFTIKMSDGSTEIIPESHIGSGVPTDHEYDYGVEVANEIRDHFNEIGFMKREWTSYEVQALGWYRMQLMKSSEGDAGEVANALYEQSRWMGSHDIMPSSRAPMNEVHPWDDVQPQYVRSIVTEGTYHASDEAEIMTGARVLNRLDSDAVVGGAYRPAHTVELVTDNWGAEQYLAHYLYLAEQDSGVLMRDYTGKTRTPNYAKGVGISLDIPARDKAHADELLSKLAAEEGGPLKTIGSHSFIAQASDGSYIIRTLWEPGADVTRNGYNRALTRSGLIKQLEKDEPGVIAGDTLVDFIRLENNWKKNPDGRGYLDIIKRGSGTHGVMRTTEQRTKLLRKYERALKKAQKSGDEKAIEAAEQELKVARAAPGGRPEGEVLELVGAARDRTRENVRSNFDKYAAREVRNERERVIGEARDGADLGTDPRWDDVLDATRGSNGERLYDRTPGGTVRAAITRTTGTERRSQLYFNRPHVTDRSLVHELIHGEAWEMDDSAVRVIAGVFNGLEGTPYGTWTPGTPLTEPQHEWLVSQFMLWIDDADSVHPVMQPLLNHFRGKLDSARTLRGEAYAPAREAIKTIDGELATLNARRAAAKTPRTIKRLDGEIAAKTAQRKAAQTELKALRATGGMSPAVKQVLDDIAARAGKRTETRASTFNADEQDMLEWAQISMASAQRRANDLVHMRGERSALERSINHPFLMMYPTSYMYGKVLPYMTEFLMNRPFGIKAPFAAYKMGQNMHQSYQRQQQYDPELRNFLYKNEPFLRAMSMFVPGLPWDMPSGMPFYARRIVENWATNQLRREQGIEEESIDIPGLIGESAVFGLTLRGPEQWSRIGGAIQQAPDIFGAMATGETPVPEEEIVEQFSP